MVRSADFFALKSSAAKKLTTQKIPTVRAKAQFHELFRC
jgi:hypothetical protein